MIELDLSNVDGVDGVEFVGINDEYVGLKITEGVYSGVVFAVDKIEFLIQDKVEGTTIPVGEFNGEIDDDQHDVIVSFDCSVIESPDGFEETPEFKRAVGSIVIELIEQALGGESNDDG